MSSRSLRPGIAAALWFLLATGAEGQTPTFRTSVEMVHLVCTVQEASGRLVADLKPQDFEVFEDDVRQKIEYFTFASSRQSPPLSVVLVLDTSRSVDRTLGFEQHAASEFLHRLLRPGRDAAAVVQFGSNVKLVHDFTSNLEALEGAVRDTYAAGATRLYDALWLSAAHLLRPRPGRRVLVVLSDGEDTLSEIFPREVERMAGENDVSIFAIGVRTPHDASNFGMLKRLAERSGGAFFNSRASLERLRRTLLKIDRAIKHQYILGYSSSRPAPEGRFRLLRVKVRRRGLSVRHRRGYYW